MMSTRIRQVVIVTFILGTIAAVKWFADPARSRAFLGPSPVTPVTMLAQAVPAVPLPAPKVSLVFVIDSSSNMQPRVGRNYFEMAREGIVKFLEREGFRDDGTYEISVIQYAKKNVPGYVQGYPGQTGTYHWFGPVHVVDEGDLNNEECSDAQANATCATKQQIIGLVKGIEHTKHFTGMLLESGLREAALLIEEDSQGESTSDYHVILLGTGEYRLSDPCPPATYRLETGCTACGSDCSTSACDCPGAACDADPYDKSCNGDGVCNRACHVRCYATKVRSIPGKPALVSAVHLGPTYHHYFSHCEGGLEAEATAPYGSDFCSFPSQPDREGFLKELANVQVNAEGQPCNSLPRGNYQRINPDLTFGNFGLEGNAEDIGLAIAQWMCGSMALRPYDPALNTDNDFLGTSQIPLFDICDNCPDRANPRQRDCNGDGIGDLCQRDNEDCCHSDDTPEQCEENSADADGDGLCHGLDQCEGGDDCLVRYWAQPKPCGTDPTTECDCDLKKCGCDCDSNNQGDICQAAQREDYQQLTHESPFALDDRFNPESADPDDAFDTNKDGIPDCATCATPTCFPVPAECDLREKLDCNMDPGQFPYGAWLEGFDQLATVNAAQWLTTNAWIYAPTELSSHLTFATDTVTNDCTNDDDIRSLVIGGNPTNPSVSWSLQSPTFAFENSSGCQIGARYNNGCGQRSCPLVGPWSFVSVDVSLMISNNNASAPLELAIFDSCLRSGEEHARVLIRFSDQISTSDQGDILFAQRIGPNEYDWEDVSNYYHNQWLQLRIVFDNTTRFTVAGAPLLCSPDTTFDTPKVAVYVRRKAGPNGCYTYVRKVLQESDSSPEVSLTPEVIPGIRMRIAGSAGSGYPLRIDSVEVHPTDGCEFSDFAGGYDANWPCAPVGSCECDSDGAWQCDTSQQVCPANAWPDCETLGSETCAE